MKKSFLSIVIIVISILFSQTILGGENEKSFYSSVLFNGKPLIYDQFSLNSRGVLTMVMNDSETKEMKTLLFKIYLKRQDKILPFGGSDHGNGLSKIEVLDILKFANLGDQLIIEPLEKKPQMPTRVIFLRYSYFLEFLNRGGNKDGC